MALNVYVVVCIVTIFYLSLLFYNNAIRLAISLSAELWKKVRRENIPALCPTSSLSSIPIFYPCSQLSHDRMLDLSLEEVGQLRAIVGQLGRSKDSPAGSGQGLSALTF